MKRIVLILICLSSLRVFSQQLKEIALAGKFQSNWKSLEQYEVPEWFRDAKFGIWAHWGPQCQPEQGDWYGRFMYDEGHWKYNSHLENYGHPSEFGFKDVIHDWKAEKWNPDSLVALYKRAGAKYFFAMGNHHDNLDLWDSKYQKWNSTNMGPEKNILEGWAKAAKNNGLPFGVSIHSSHAWTWYETAQRSDKEGKYAGVPYDGVLTKADGIGKWWEGYDPQELYVQNHPLSEGSENTNSLFNQWDWNNGAAIPSEEYILNFYNRTVDMINKYHPDLLYFDDSELPFYPISEVGLEIAAHYYNSNLKKHDGKLEAVLFGKKLSEVEKECLVWDVERGAPDNIQEKPWQSCTCIGDWHYDIGVYKENRYKSAKTVIQLLVDIVSKNGNLLLNIPVKGDGTIDDKELKIVEDITIWMDINSECIYKTRPWQIFGESPRTDKSNPLSGAGFNERKKNDYTSKDIRFTQKSDTLYAIVMDYPNSKELVIKSLGTESRYYSEKYKNVELLGSNIKSCNFNRDGLKIILPDSFVSDMPIVIRIY